ncbi:hypothetical protein ACFWY6_02915 [Streptomyces sp. NPDC059037]|uniref:hypothetical protein n=1 Tax=Streptomyces sp. NPDC059037 TaxID=3346710 RepID=UPI00369EC581
MRKVTGRITASVTATLVLAGLPASAYAIGPGGTGKGGSETDSSGAGQIHAETKVQTTVNGRTSTAKTGTLYSADSNWTPPACWYEPAFSPKELKKSVGNLRKYNPFGLGNMVADMYDGYYKDGKPYEDYNLDKQGEGMFWAGVVNPNREDDPEATSCDKAPFWVDKADTPDEPLALSPEILAEYAYDELPVPGTEIEAAPAGKSTVNLPTWIWLNKAKFKKVSVTASLPGTGLSATTTAEPVSLHIDPGTEDADTFPASGNCRINADGSIGEAYAKGKSKDTPPCGVNFLRATDASAAYELKATITWKISWTSTTGEGDDLPDGTYGSTQDVTVQEIQSINR